MYPPSIVNIAVCHFSSAERGSLCWQCRIGLMSSFSAGEGFPVQFSTCRMQCWDKRRVCTELHRGAQVFPAYVNNNLIENRFVHLQDNDLVV